MVQTKTQRRAAAQKLLVLEKEMQPQKKVLEEKPQGDLLEGEDDRIFFSFFITFYMNC